METPCPSTVTLFPLSTAFRPSTQERFCRLCMDNPHATRLQRFYDDDEPVNPDLLNEIRNLINIEIVYPDDQHSVICSRCLRKLEDYFIFRKHCQAVDVGLREMRAKNSPALTMSPDVPVRVTPQSPSLPPPPPPPAVRQEEECQVVEPVEPQEDSMGIFESMMFCQSSPDRPDYYHLVKERFIYRPLSLFAWICEVESCGCWLDVDKDLSLCQEKAEHGHVLEGHDEREFCKINPAVRAFLNTLPKEVPSKTDLRSEDETVLNIQSYQQDNDPEQRSGLSCPNVDIPKVAFFTCVERGLSLTHGGYSYLLTQVRLEGGSCMWQCPFRECTALLASNAELTIFKPLSEHAHAPPNPSVLNEITGNPISHDQAFDELAACPASDDQVDPPEVTFYRPLKSDIGVLYNGYYFRLDKFLVGGRIRWKCTRHDCSAQLDLTETLHCWQVPAGESAHGHPRQYGTVCSAANIMSPVKALIELNKKRDMVGDQQEQQRQDLPNMGNGKPQLRVKLDKAQLSPDLANQTARYSSPRQKTFYRYKRTLVVELEGHYYRLFDTKSKTSWWRCTQCPVRIILNVRLNFSSMNCANHVSHTQTVRLVSELRPISQEEVKKELSKHRKRN